MRPSHDFSIVMHSASLPSRKLGVSSRHHHEATMRQAVIAKSEARMRLDICISEILICWATQRFKSVPNQREVTACARCC